MYALSRGGSRRSINIWPGFVDGLATLLLVVIFVLMVFMVAQFFLSAALSGRDEALERLNREVNELAELLALERAANADLRINVAQLSSELQSSLRERESLSEQINLLVQERDRAEQELSAAQADRTSLAAQIAALIEERDSLDRLLQQAEEATNRNREELEAAFAAIEADREKVEAQLAELAILKQLRDELEAQLNEMEAAMRSQEADAETLRQRLSEEEEARAEQIRLTEEAQSKVDLLNRQIAALRQQLARLAVALDAAETQNEEQEVQIADLGRRLNIALATKVQELARYRSEFFGRLREVLGTRPDIRVVGDRFVFQSELLFGTGEAELGNEGKVQLQQLADALQEITAEIPDDIDWILRVDGHTDKRPIFTAAFPSNWDLSTARAVSVVNFLVDQGIPPQRLAATGFGEFQPLDEGNDEIAYRRNRRIEFKFTQK